MGNKRKLKYILLFAFVCTLTLTFVVKKTVYNLKQQIIVVENRIEELENEKYMLKVEWSYLTSPDRLMKIAKKADLKIPLEPISISTNQIKKLEDLIPYYYAKSRMRNDVNAVAVRNQKPEISNQ